MEVKLISFAILFGVASFSIIEVNSQNSIWFMQQTETAMDAIPLTRSLEIAPTIVRRSQKLCVQGIWALYTERNYGRANINSVTVYPARGESSTSCTSNPVGNILRQIQSIRRIGSDDPALPISLYPQKYFISNKEAQVQNMVDRFDAAPPGGAPPPPAVRSFTIHGGATMRAFRLCAMAVPAVGPFTDCFCGSLNEFRNLVVPDLDAFPTTANPFRTIGRIDLGADCMSLCSTCQLLHPTLRMQDDIFLAEGSASV